MKQVWDILLTGVIIVVALCYLYRKFVVNKGCSCGSSSCTSAESDQRSIGSAEKNGDDQKGGNPWI